MGRQSIQLFVICALRIYTSVDSASIRRLVMSDRRRLKVTLTKIVNELASFVYTLDQTCMFLWFFRLTSLNIWIHTSFDPPQIRRHQTSNRHRFNVSLTEIVNNSR